MPGVTLSKEYATIQSLGEFFFTIGISIFSVTPGGKVVSISINDFFFYI